MAYRADLYDVFLLGCFRCGRSRTPVGYRLAGTEDGRGFAYLVQPGTDREVGGRPYHQDSPRDPGPFWRSLSWRAPYTLQTTPVPGDVHRFVYVVEHRKCGHRWSYSAEALFERLKARPARLAL